MRTRNFLLLISVLILVSAALPVMSGSSSLNLTVYTSKPSYQVDENIEVYGNLTYDSAPVSDNLVAIEVQNPDGDPVVLRSAQTDSYGACNLTFKLSSDAELGAYTVHVSSTYKGQTATNNTTFKLIQISETIATKDGVDYPITIESNATITNATANRNTLSFNSTGSSGDTAYVNVTMPQGLNTTEIKVFIDSTELVPPPFPIITSNGTHYFVYFEFTLSTHEIEVQYAINDITIIDLTTSTTEVFAGYPVTINVTARNLGSEQESFNVTAYYADTAIDTQEVNNLASNTNTTLTFTWDTTGIPDGINYQVKAEASFVQDEMNISNNVFVDGTIRIKMVKIISVISCDQTGNPKENFPIGSMAYFKATINNTATGNETVLLTVNVFDLDSSTIGVASFQGSIMPEISTFIIGLPIPTSADVGQATVYANAFSDWPHNGGGPYCLEKSDTFQIAEM